MNHKKTISRTVAFYDPLYSCGDSAFWLPCTTILNPAQFRPVVLIQSHCICQLVITEAQYTHTKKQTNHQITTSCCFNMDTLWSSLWISWLWMRPLRVRNRDRGRLLCVTVVAIFHCQHRSMDKHWPHGTLWPWGVHYLTSTQAHMLHSALLRTECLPALTNTSLSYFAFNMWRTWTILTPSLGII